jgi:diguanylate cyclase (GGDEF)-like protein/PAS domain S-box-containing protein
MPRTRFELTAEVDALRARLAQVENGSAPPPSGESAASGTGPAEAGPIESNLKASEVRYRRLFETAKDGILILDADTGQVTDVNPFLEELLNYSHGELLGKTLWDIGPFQDIVASQDAFRQLQNKQYVRYENLPLEAREGQRKNVEFVSNVYLVDGKRVIQCNIRDITERRQAEESVQKANEELSALVTELRARDRDMQLINRLNGLLQACTTQEEAYKVIALLAGELFPGQSGCVARLHGQDRQLETIAGWGDETTVDALFSVNDCWAMRRGQPHQVTDPRTGLLCRHFVRQPETGYVCIPLTVQGETLGLLCLVGIAAMSGRRPGGQEQLAAAVGEAIKLSLSNLKLREELREQATRDPLTGLYNRRYLEESLQRELHRARRASTPVCVAMLDLDHFKQLNDALGHDAGDALLRAMGQLLRERLRKSDIACRYGGEEFVIVLSDSTIADTVQKVEQIGMLVKQLEVRQGNQSLGRMALSAGVAALPEHGFTGPELLRAADEAMYAAKQAGRDRVLVAEIKK